MREIAYPFAVFALVAVTWGLGWLFVAAVGRWLHWKHPDQFDQKGNPNP